MSQVIARFKQCPVCRGERRMTITVTCPGCNGNGSVDDMDATARQVLDAYRKYVDTDDLDQLQEAMTELQEAVDQRARRGIVSDG